MQELGTFAALDEYPAYLWHCTAGIDTRNPGKREEHTI
jgi:hypothetical protein